jgi:hypothetical protein
MIADAWLFRLRAVFWNVLQISKILFLLLWQNDKPLWLLKKNQIKHINLKNQKHKPIKKWTVK